MKVHSLQGSVQGEQIGVASVKAKVLHQLHIEDQASHQQQTWTSRLLLWFHRGLKRAKA